MPRRTVGDARRKARAEAEKRMRDPSARTQAPADLQHELHVHQIELEMQNEELRRTTKALEEARDLYSEVFHFAPVGYAILSDAGLIQEVNLTGAGLLGRERRELLGHPFLGLIDREDASRWRQLFPSLTRAGEWLSFRLYLVKRDGSRFPARVACEGRMSGDGMPVVRIVITDISEQVEAENELRASQQRLADVLDEFHDGFWEWSAGGNMVVSGRLAPILGLADGSDGADLSYNPAWVDRIHLDDRPKARAIAADLLEGRVDLLDVVVRWNPRNGVEKWVRARGRVAERDSARRALRIRGTVSDISSYIELRDSIRRLEAQKAMLSDIIRNFPGGAVGLFDNSLRFIHLDGRGEVGSYRGGQSLVSRLVLEDYPPESRDRLAAAFRSALDGKTTDFEMVIEGVRLQARVGPVTDSAGRVTRGVASFHTVRERERAPVAKK